MNLSNGAIGLNTNPSHVAPHHNDLTVSGGNHVNGNMANRLNCKFSFSISNDSKDSHDQKEKKRTDKELLSR